MKYLKYFKTEAEYNTFIQSEDFILPNVSYAVDANSTFYHVVKTETGDYKIYLLEKKNISGLTYNMVDLGLPSGLLWADRNVGATSPEDFGTYFAWGETSGYNVSIKYCAASELCAYMQPLFGDKMTLTPDNIDEILSETGVTNKDMTTIGMGFSTDKCFSNDWSDYFDTTDGGSTFNKYSTDKLTVLQPEDDAATVNMGSEYRMPTEADVNELIDNCTATFIDINGNEFSKSEVEGSFIPAYNLKGVKFTGSNGNSIFILASCGCNNAILFDIYNTCELWLSSLYSDNSTMACCLHFNCYGYLNDVGRGRDCGQATRGVKILPSITFDYGDESVAKEVYEILWNRVKSEPENSNLLIPTTEIGYASINEKTHIYKYELNETFYSSNTNYYVEGEGTCDMIYLCYDNGFSWNEGVCKIYLNDGTIKYSWFSLPL